MSTYLAITDNPIIELPPAPGMERSVYIIDTDSIHGVNAALATGRPLLIRGKPGIGKSTLARAVARRLERAFRSHAVDARTEVRDLLYSIDHVRRLAQAQVSAILRNKEQARAEIALQRFVEPGPIWWAFDWGSARAQAVLNGAREEDLPAAGEAKNGCVVLVDEIDKSDTAVPSGLLEALGEGCFRAPWGDKVSRRGDLHPLIVLTTNEERVLPDAFLRRCIVLHLELPEDEGELREKLTAYGREHLKDHLERCYERLFDDAADQLIEARDAYKKRDLTPPGVAEYIDLLWAVVKQRPTPDGQRDLLEATSRFTFEKHPKDEAG